MKARVAISLMGLTLVMGGCGGSGEGGFKPSQNLKVEKAYRNSLDDNSKVAVSLPLNSEGTYSYIVELRDPAVASYTGNIKGFKATSPVAKGLRRLDVNAEESVVYSTMLADKQDELLQGLSQTFGRTVTATQRYKHTLNGFALKLSAEEARKIAAMPEVKSITKDGLKKPLTDVGPQWIGVEALWNADESSSLPEIATKGEGTVIAVIDTGINNIHPSFADIGDDGYDHDNPLGSGVYLPGSHCDTVDPDFCNDKIIGAWAFSPADFDEEAPLDNTGHGSHTASIAAGNVIKFASIDAPTATFFRSISGVAPHANIIAYDACHSIGCPSSSILAAVEQVVIDASVLPNGIQALNLSIGIESADSPYSDPIAQGFLNATAAGIYVSTAAGNTGPSESTLFNTSPWVATVAATTHNRKLANNLVDITSDDGAFGQIPALGFTTGYGPAPIIYAGHFPTDNDSPNDTDPGQCLEPFPEGHFDGEIVICDRGTEARVDKGANVLAGGAGGFVLANVESSEIVMSDAHFLPALHIDFEDAQTLKEWLSCQTNAVATISGVVVDEKLENGDVMADFSSRGPVTGFDLLKPDIAAPGVNVLAAVIASESRPQIYDFISGTSMSSPHHAGAAALLSSIRPSWTPHEIKSALMMTATNIDLFKEDGFSPTDVFDVGSGRMELKRIQHVDLVLNETPENFLASNPELGGDPSSLNLASMQSGRCVEKCFWERRLKNVGAETSRYALKVIALKGLKFQVSPESVELQPGEEIDITVEANTVFASDSWAFARLELSPLDAIEKPKLQMPIAIKSSTSSNIDFLEMSVDKVEAAAGEILNYQVSLANGQLEGPISLEVPIPDGLSLVDGSLSEELTRGSSDRDFRERNGKLVWEGELQKSSIEVGPDSSPLGSAGFFSIASFTEPSGCPEDCDEGAFILDVPEFAYHGKKYTQVIWSVNGTIQVGVEGGKAASFNPSQFPSEAEPNNLVAPFWTDLNFSEEDAAWYVNVITNGSNEFIVFEWANVSSFAVPGSRYNFQVWIQVGDSGNMWFAYGEMGDITGNNFLSIGAESEAGDLGYSYYNNGEGTLPLAGVDLGVFANGGGRAKLSFQGELRDCDNSDQVTIVRTHLDTDDGGENAYTATRCVP